MAQIFTGEGLGTYGSSLGQLGSYGPKGTAGLGQGPHSVYINAANGNLVVRENDGFLAGLGFGYRTSSTYNSRGEGAGMFRLGSQSRVSLHGTLNESGSVLLRTAADGHVSRFYYNTERGIYQDENGGKAHIKASKEGFLYNGGDNDIIARYDLDGRLSQLKDADGHHWDFHYEATGELRSVTDTNAQQKICWSFKEGRLSDISAQSDGKTVHHIHYEYDDTGRLRKESLDLQNGKHFWTTFSYDGDSNRISEIRQSDGVCLGIRYDNEGRVKELIDGEGHHTFFTYQTRQTVVRNERGEQWVYCYDEQARLSAIEGPEGRRISYRYDGNYLSEVIDGSRHWSFKYNDLGDCIEITEPNGSITYREFDEHHHLLKETRAGANQRRDEGDSSYCLYDDKGHLRYKIAANGVVTEYLYNSEGQLCYERTFLKGRFNSAIAFELEDLEAWVKQQDLTALKLTEFHYDWRGQLDWQKQYRKTDAAGRGMEGEAIVSAYQYDAAGRLIQSSKYHGAKIVTTIYVYDDLGRLTDTIDSDGNHQRIDYDDAGQRIVSTDARGMVRVQFFDKSGNLLLSQTLDETERVLGTTRYHYDNTGRLIAEEKPNGALFYYFYDKESRLKARVDGEGALTEYRYNENDAVVWTCHYATLLDTSGWLEQAPEFKDIRPDSKPQDRIQQNLFDDAGQLRYEIDNEGGVCEYRYTSRGQLAEKIKYQQRLSAAQTKALMAGKQRLDAIGIQENPAKDRRHRYYYDSENRLIAEVDGEHYATEYRYDALGNCWQKRRFYHAVTAKSLSANWEALRPAPSNKDIVSHQFYNAAGELIAELDGERYLTEYHYDERGLLAEKISYANKALLSEYSEHTNIEAIRPKVHDNDRHISYVYNDKGLLVEEKGPFHKRTTYSYDAGGNLIQKTVEDTLLHQQRETRYRYDIEGRLIQSLDEIGAEKLRQNKTLSSDKIEAIWQAHSTRYYYDTAGQLTEKVNPLGQKTRYFYDLSGHIQASVDADGRVNTRQYNAFGELISQRRFAKTLETISGVKDYQTLQQQLNLIADDAHDALVSYEYNTLGQIIAEHQGTHKLKTLNYNSFGELAREDGIIDAHHQNTILYKYDRRGLNTEVLADPDGIHKKTQTKYNSFGLMEENIDSYGNTHKFYYFKNGLLYLDSDALGHSNQYEYDAFGRLTSTIDALMHAVDYQYNDKKGELVVIGKDDTVKQRIITDAFNNQLSITDAAGQCITFQYNARGELIEEIDAQNNHRLYRYDEAGQLVWQEDSLGIVTEWHYDAKGRILDKTLDPEGLCLKHTYYYDGTGRLISETSPSALSKQYEYDDAGRLCRSVVDPNGLTLVTTYEYDERGLLIQETKQQSQGANRVILYQ